MITESSINLNDLINISGEGVVIPTFVEIKAALVKKYKDIYGEDIDLSEGTADGEFIDDISLIINNICQSFLSLYKNLNVNSASGIYLDNLCNLSNVHRKPATKSQATIQLENNTGSDFTLDYNSEFMDQGGVLWQYLGESQVLANGDILVITVTCENSGPITAPSGWITEMVNESDIAITQSNAAIVGSNAETDEELRSRRNQYTSTVGVTVLQSLSAALLDVQAVKDVKIYNNSSDADASQSSDGTDTLAHGIYIVIRQTSNEINIDDTIGEIIYNKLTPGIRTTQTSDTTSGNDKSYTYIPTLLGQTVPGSEVVYWKQAKPIAPNTGGIANNGLRITYTFLDNRGYDTELPKILAEEIIAYINGLALGENINTNDLLMTMLLADNKPKGLSTINVSYSDIQSAIYGFNNTDTYFNYSELADTIINGNDVTLVIK